MNAPLGRINGINTTTGATLQNGSLILRPRDWGVYGTICCGGIDQESQCYHICPQHPGSYDMYCIIALPECLHACLSTDNIISNTVILHSQRVVRTVLCYQLMLQQPLQ